MYFLGVAIIGALPLVNGCDLDCGGGGGDFDGGDGGDFDGGDGGMGQDY